MRNEPEDLFSSAHYAAVRRPLLEAETLPAWCYRSEAFFAREMERVFRPAWRFVGRADELDAPGAYLSVWTAAGPALVVRSEDGKIRAFANTCRHRGAELVSGSGRCKALVCPYHAWSYHLDGTLRSAPGMETVVGFEKSEYGLVPLRLESWAGFLFINPDPEAPGLAASLGDMMERFACYGFEAMRTVRRVDFTIDANWKLLVENALEAYHTGTVHRDTVGRQEAEALSTDGDWTGLLVVDERSVATLPDVPPPFPTIPTLEGDARRGTYFTMIYPSTQFACAQDCMWWLDFQPVSPTRTRLTLGSCFPERAIAQANFEQAVRPYYDRLDRATPEDNAICETQQRGLASDLRGPGRFAASEFAVHALDNWVLDRVLD